MLFYDAYWSKYIQCWNKMRTTMTHMLNAV